MATNFSPVLGVLCFKPTLKYCNFWYKGFYLSASGVLQGHHSPLVWFYSQEFSKFESNPTSIWLNQTVYPYRSCITVFSKSIIKLRMQPGTVISVVKGLLS